MLGGVRILKIHGTYLNFKGFSKFSLFVISALSLTLVLSLIVNQSETTFAQVNEPEISSKNIVSENVLIKDSPISPNVEESCLNNSCAAIIYSSPVFTKDINGEWKNITDVISFSVTPDFGINITRDNGENMVGRIFANYQGNNISLNELKNILGSGWGSVIKARDHRSSWKFTIELTNIPEGLNYVIIKWNRSSTTIIDDYSDLIYNNFSVKTNQNEILIGNFSANLVNSSLLDPTITTGNETGGQEKINDTFAKSDDPSSNFGTFSYLAIRTTPLACSPDCNNFPYILVNFSKTVVNPTSITNATFYLTEKSGTFSDSGTVKLFNVTNQSAVDNYNEYSLTWNNQPCVVNSGFGGCNSTPQATLVVNNSDSVYGFDVTSIAQSVMSSTKAFLFYMNTTAATNGQVFESKEGAPNASVKPYLYIEFTNQSGQQPSNLTQSIMIGGGYYGDTTDTRQQFMAFYGDRGISTVYLRQQTFLPTNGTIQNLYVSKEAGGSDVRFALYRNNISTGLSCEMLSTGTSCSDLTNRVNVSAGDTIAMGLNMSSPVSTGYFRFVVHIT